MSQAHQEADTQGPACFCAPINFKKFMSSSTIVSIIILLPSWNNALKSIAIMYFCNICRQRKENTSVRIASTSGTIQIAHLSEHLRF